MADHAKFLAAHSADISMEVTDETFTRRLPVTVDGLQMFLGGMEKVVALR